MALGRHWGARCTITSAWFVQALWRGISGTAYGRGRPHRGAAR
jgi:hypothetical protein